MGCIGIATLSWISDLLAASEMHELYVLPK